MEDGQTLLDEIDEFERTFAQTNPRAAKEWSATLDDALTGKAKSWRDYVILSGPGKNIYEATLGVGARQEDYARYYRYIRGELFSRAGMKYENPGESTKKRWENIRFPDNLKSREDLDEALETIVAVYQQLVRHGMIVAGDEQDERRLVTDLNTKVERGTEFRKWFYGLPGAENVHSVRDWLDRAQAYLGLLPYRKSRERGYVAHEEEQEIVESSEGEDEE